jgi:hypothetical protein
MLPRSYFVQSLKCPSLLTLRNGPYTTCTACSESDMLHFERGPVNRGRDASKKLHYTFIEVPFFIDRS